jgi:hypothetical protein
VFPVRYELNSYILFRGNSAFKGLSWYFVVSLVVYLNIHAVTSNYIKISLIQNVQYNL